MSEYNELKNEHIRLQANYDQRDSFAKKYQQKYEECEQNEHKIKHSLNNLQADFNELNEK
jgi:hypothetical protein